MNEAPTFTYPTAQAEVLCGVPAPGERRSSAEDASYLCLSGLLGNQ